MGVAMYLRWLCFLPASLAFDVFGRLPVESVQGWKAGLLAVLLREALPDLRRLEVRSHRRRMEDMGTACPGLCVRSTLGVFSPDKRLGPKQVIHAGEGAHDV